MTYNVQAGTGGFLGWKILERTSERQMEIFQKSAEIQRSRDYFSENISSIESADDLVSNYKLLSVALRAFGLDDDIKNRAFIKKVIEADPEDDNSIVNKLSDKRYLGLNKALNMSSSAVLDGTASVSADSVINLYVTRSFEKNVGERYEEIELALNARRELPTLAKSSSSENTKWYTVLGNKALRTVFETAFGLGSSFSTLPVDRQLQEIKAKFEKFSGSSDLSKLSNEKTLNDVLTLYLIKNGSGVQTGQNKFSVALTLLGG